MATAGAIPPMLLSWSGYVADAAQLPSVLWAIRVSYLVLPLAMVVVWSPGPPPS